MMTFTQQINLRLLKGTFEENSNQEVYEGSTEEDTNNSSRTKQSKGTSWLHGNIFQKVFMQKNFLLGETTRLDSRQGGRVL